MNIIAKICMSELKIAVVGRTVWTARYGSPQYQVVLSPDKMHELNGLKKRDYLQGHKVRLDNLHSISIIILLCLVLLKIVIVIARWLEIGTLPGWI